MRSSEFTPAPVENYLGLGDLIARLEREDPARVVPLGFANPHSFRGHYMELAFEPVRDISVGDMLAAARSALGETFQGWKGGDYTMHEHTSCWIAQRGDSSDNQIGPLLLDLLLTATRSGRCEVCGEVGDVRRTDDPDPRAPQVICVDLEACAIRFPDVVDAEACEQS